MTVELVFRFIITVHLAAAIYNLPPSCTQPLSNMTELLSLPPEILEFIAQAIAEEDLISLRSTCRALRNASNILFAQAYFTKRYHVATHYSLIALQAISKHPFFGPFIQSITLTCIQAVSDREDTRNCAVIPNPFALLDPSEDSGLWNSNKTHRFNLRMYHLRVTQTCKYLVPVLDLIKKRHGKVVFGLNDMASPNIRKVYGLRQLLRSTGSSAVHVYNFSATLSHLTFAANMVGCPFDRIEVDLRHDMKWAREPGIIGNTISTLFRAELRRCRARLDVPPFVPKLDILLQVMDRPGHQCSLGYNHRENRLKICGLNSVSLYNNSPQVTLLTNFLELIEGPSMDIRAISVTKLEIVDCRIRNRDGLFRHVLKHYLGSLKTVRLHRIDSNGRGLWSFVIQKLANAPNLTQCSLIKLTSSFNAYVGSGPRHAEFNDVERFEVQGPTVTNELQDLFARLHPEETAWEAKSWDDPKKWPSSMDKLPPAPPPTVHTIPSTLEPDVQPAPIESETQTTVTSSNAQQTKSTLEKKLKSTRREVEFRSPGETVETTTPNQKTQTTPARAQARSAPPEPNPQTTTVKQETKTTAREPVAQTTTPKPAVQSPNPEPTPQIQVSSSRDRTPRTPYTYDTSHQMDTRVEQWYWPMEDY